jgi:hypothetical protein
MEAQVLAMRAEFAAEQAAAQALIDQAMASDALLSQDRHAMAHSRMADSV